MSCTQQQHTAHCALAHPHPTYSIVKAGGASVQFPVECSVDLSHPAFGRVAQEIIINSKIKTVHVGSAFACHHRKQQQREREQPPRGRAGRPLQGGSWHHFQSYRAAPRSPCWEYNGGGEGQHSVILPPKLYRNLKTKSLCFCLSGFMLSNVESGKQSVAPGGSTTYCMWRCLDFLGLRSGLDVRLNAAQGWSTQKKSPRAN